ncbi:hypothetical protein K458DRAFT_192780 [Lentithecium fluviatile CBS 122367]|uniref:Uncharacterized protein n=1 Tax=Lentithecium fluviatile CBS 122367 TaxID=1168545 RepID=A0A6G1IDS6_9PLEO|nr:hypothetical protein K458DRAFT_192780 [Lentithecium fluviatile CBS 122367]
MTWPGGDSVALHFDVPLSSISWESFPVQCFLWYRRICRGLATYLPSRVTSLDLEFGSPSHSVIVTWASKACGHTGSTHAILSASPLIHTPPYSPPALPTHHHERHHPLHPRHHPPLPFPLPRQRHPHTSQHPPPPPHNHPLGPARTAPRTPLGHAAGTRRRPRPTMYGAASSARGRICSMRCAGRIARLRGGLRPCRRA